MALICNYRSVDKILGVIVESALCNKASVFFQSANRAIPAAVWRYLPGIETEILGTPARERWMAPASVPPLPGCRNW